MPRSIVPALLVAAAAVAGLTGLRPGAALACDPVTIAAGFVADGPAADDRAPLEVRIAALRAEIEALERSLAALRTAPQGSAGGAARFRILGSADEPAPGAGVIVLGGGGAAAPTIPGEPGSSTGAIVARKRSAGEGGDAAIAIEGVGASPRVYRLSDDVPRARRTAPAARSGRSVRCCCCCCCEGGAVGRATEAAPSVTLRRRAVEFGTSGAPARLRSCAPIAPAAPQPHRILQLRALPGGPDGEPAAIIERSTVAPSCPAAPCGAGSAAPAAPLPEPLDPFGALPPGGAGSGVASGGVREAPVAPVVLPAAVRVPVRIEVAPRAVVREGVEYY